VAGTVVAAVTWIGYKVGWFSFGTDLDESMWGAGLAFVSVAVVAVAVTFATTPKPREELQGLVYGMANEDEYAARRTHAWWESPKLLGFTTLAGAAILTIIFW
jgi:SSS family solute:Na+ symporter